jgi:hypothetical protein
MFDLSVVSVFDVGRLGEGIGPLEFALVPVSRRAFSDLLTDGVGLDRVARVLGDPDEVHGFETADGRFVAVVRRFSVAALPTDSERRREHALAALNDASDRFGLGPDDCVWQHLLLALAGTELEAQDAQELVLQSAPESAQLGSSGLELLVGFGLSLAIDRCRSPLRRSAWWPEVIRGLCLAQLIAVRREALQRDVLRFVSGSARDRKLDELELDYLALKADRSLAAESLQGLRWRSFETFLSGWGRNSEEFIERSLLLMRSRQLASSNRRRNSLAMFLNVVAIGLALVAILSLAVDLTWFAHSSVVPSSEGPSSIGQGVLDLVALLSPNSLITIALGAGVISVAVGIVLAQRWRE